MKITSSDDGTVTVELTKDEAVSLQDHLLWDKHATEETVAGQLWKGLGETLDSSQGSA
jgi:hypothetical protein